MKNQKKIKYYAVWAEEGGLLEIGYNLTSKKEVVKLLKEYLQSATTILDYNTMTQSEFLNYIRYHLFERYRIKSSQFEFPLYIFEKD
jgi:hypothetical protein